MKKILSIMAFFTGSVIILSSCNKDTLMSGNDPSNYDALYVVNRASNSLSVVNISTDQVEKTRSLGSPGTMMGGGMMNGNSTFNNMWPDHISLSPDKSKLAITEPGMDFDSGYEMMQSTSTTGRMGTNNYQHHNGNSTTQVYGLEQMRGKILILDAVSGDLKSEISLEGMPYDAIFSPDGKELWTTLMMPNGKVMVFDADSYVLLDSISVGTMPAGVTFSDDGKKVFVANAMSGTITVIDAATKMVIDNIETGQGIVGTFMGMNGIMYVNNEKNQTMNMINMMNNLMSDSIRFDFTPGMVSSNTMMNQIWASDPANSKIHLWTQNGTGYMHGGSISVGAGASSIVFSKTGVTCYVTNQDDNSVSVVDVPGLKELMRIPVGEKPNGMIIRYK
ncbi:MAG: YncE family protein [Bacteroidales bacterium]|nr:YncE family protein [Bacteroidales bacterium]